MKNKIITRTHPEYNYTCGKIDLYKSAYFNTDRFRNNIWKHQRESDSDYKKRTSLGSHTNYFKFIINLFLKNIYSKKNNIRRELSDTLTKYIYTIGPHREDIDSIMKKALLFNLITTKSYIWINSENSVVYARIFDFEDIVDYCEKVYEIGFDWILLKTKVYNNIDPFVEAKEETVYILFTEKEIIQYDAVGNILGEPIENTIGKVPFVKFDIFNDENSIVDELYELDLEIFNIMNLYISELYSQLFSIITYPEDVELGGNWELKEGNILPYSIQSSNKPEFLNRSLAFLDEKRNHIQFLISEMLRVAGFSNKDEVKETANAESGVAKAYDFLNTNETLTAIAKKLEEKEYEIFYLVNLYLNNSNTDFDKFTEENIISYPKNYDMISNQSEVTNLYTLLDANMSEDINNKTKEIIVDKVLDDYCSTDEIESLKKSIENSESTVNNNENVDVQTSTNDVSDKLANQKEDNNDLSGNI